MNSENSPLRSHVLIFLITQHFTLAKVKGKMSLQNWQNKADRGQTKYVLGEKPILISFFQPTNQQYRAISLSDNDFL